MHSPNPEIEDQLIKGCIREEAKAQEGLYRHFYGYGMSICLRYAGNKEEATDILNDGFLKVFTKIRKYDFQSPLKAWLRKILVNTAIDYYRMSKKAKQMVDIQVMDQASSEVDVVSKLSAEEILGLLHLLPEHYRLAFNLHEIEGYSHEEIGVMLSIPAGTSRSNLARAKKRLRDMVTSKFRQAKYYA